MCNGMTSNPREMSVYPCLVSKVDSEWGSLRRRIRVSSVHMTRDVHASITGLMIDHVGVDSICDQKVRTQPQMVGGHSGRSV